MNTKNNLNITQFETPLGTMLAFATDKGICLLEFADRDILDSEIKQLTKLFDAKIIKETNNLLDMLKKPKAVRAVANANGVNKISIIIPCHRVIGSDGSLTGYGGGLWRKKWLLDLENKNKVNK